VFLQGRGLRRGSEWVNARIPLYEFNVHDMFSSQITMYDMSQQPYFPGFEPPASARHFVFRSPFTDGLRNRTAESLRHLHGLNGRLIGPERLHLSLHTIGRYDGLPGFIIERAYEAGAMVSTSPFPLVFDRVMSFDNRREKRGIMAQTPQAKRR
jgi:hypothetical protein